MLHHVTQTMQTEAKNEGIELRITLYMVDIYTCLHLTFRYFSAPDPTFAWQATGDIQLKCFP